MAVSTDISSLPSTRSSSVQSQNVQLLDILAIAAHRDDVEQTCGGTLLKAAQRGQRAGILDLTQGEMGTRGTADDRAREAADAAKILGVSWRRALDIPDGRVENTWENRLKVASVIRETRPRVIILPYWKGRHPDHYTASVLGYEACFLAGLAKLDPKKALSSQLSAVSQTPSDANADVPLAPHRPFKILYATLYYDVRPTFVVDIGEQFEGKFASILAYKSQFSDQEAGKDLFPAHDEIRARVEAMARFYGMLGGVTHAEPFLQKEVGLVEDLLAIPVKSI
ncbi:MAG: bacillithiol biosynthesis deacetylase BshB1 [Candidatus Sulfotelmatobacter sp.]|jgi:bacillithiol biosynthesis deacetylase BshB1